MKRAAAFALYSIAIVTAAARRTQYHQSVLVAQATPLDARYLQLLGNLTDYFSAHGLTLADAMVRAQALALLERQASYLGFLDCLTVLGWFVLMGLPLVFLIRRFASTGSSENH